MCLAINLITYLDVFLNSVCTLHIVLYLTHALQHKVWIFKFCGTLALLLGVFSPLSVFREMKVSFFLSNLVFSVPYRVSFLRSPDIIDLFGTEIN